MLRTRPIRLRPFRVLLAALAVLAGVGIGMPAAAGAASTCAAQQVGVAALQSNVFYIDVDQSYLGSYVGYRVTNTGSGSRSGLWVRLESFTGGVLGPATGAASTAPLPIDALAASASTPAYAYLKATGQTSTAQRHDIVVYQGRPGAGGTELCRETQTVAAVADVIKAAANKVTGASVSSASSSAATLGGTFQLTVTGETGTIGAGPASDPEIVRFSPAVAGAWPSSAFRLIGVSSKLPTSAPAVADRLSISHPSSTANQSYSVTYTFRVVGPTTTPTPIVPVQNIASGTQVKHTDPGSLGAIAPIPVVTASATVGVAAPTAGPYASGQTVPLQATVTNSGSGAITLDEMRLSLPPGWTYVAGSAKRDGTALADPNVTGGTALRLVGPFTVGGNATSTFTIDAIAGSPGSSGSFSGVGTLDAGQVDTTANVSDDQPSSTVLKVLGRPTAQDDTYGAATGTTTTFDVAANDDLAGGTPALAITTQPTHGTAVIAGGRVEYTPNSGYSGPDTLTYVLTTQGGYDQANVTITVAVPPPVPMPPALTSGGVGTAGQSVTIAVPTAGSATLLTSADAPVTTLSQPGVGTYVLDPATGVIAFTPVLGYTGTAPAVAYSVTDSFGGTGRATYVPTVSAPPGPAAPVRTSSGVGTTAQTRVLPVPTGGSVSLLDGGQAVASLVVAGQGNYVLDATTGEVFFTPRFGFSGVATPVAYRVTDAYGQTNDSTYTPSVVAPAGPSPSPETSNGTGTASQGSTLGPPPGGSVRLLDGTGQPVTRLTVAGEGSYELNPTSGAVTFTPLVGFSGPATPVTYRLTDAYGQAATATYTPTVARPAAPVAETIESSGPPDDAQARIIAIPTGGTATLLDSDGSAVASVRLINVGTYALSGDVVSFTPEVGFGGTPRAVRYRITDAYGQSVEASYQPVVESAPRAAPAPAPEMAEAPAAPCVSLRRMTIHWKVPRGVRLRDVRMLINGQVAARISARTRQVVVDLRGRPAESVAVLILAKTTRGQTLHTARTYRTCRVKFVPPPLPTLRLTRLR